MVQSSDFAQDRMLSALSSTVKKLEKLLFVKNEQTSPCRIFACFLTNSSISIVAAGRAFAAASSVWCLNAKFAPLPGLARINSWNPHLKKQCFIKFQGKRDPKLRKIEHLPEKKCVTDRMTDGWYDNSEKSRKIVS